MVSQTSWSPNIVGQTAEREQKRRHCKQFPWWSNAVARSADTSNLPPALVPVHLNTLKPVMCSLEISLATTMWTSGSLQKPSPVMDFRGALFDFHFK